MDISMNEVILYSAPIVMYLCGLAIGSYIGEGRGYRKGYDKARQDRKTEASGVKYPLTTEMELDVSCPTALTYEIWDSNENTLKKDPNNKMALLLRSELLKMFGPSLLFRNRENKTLTNKLNDNESRTTRT